MQVSPYEHNQGKRTPCFSLRFLNGPKSEPGFSHSKKVSRFGFYVQIPMSTFFLCLPLSLLPFLSTIGIYMKSLESYHYQYMLPSSCIISYLKQWANKSRIHKWYGTVKHKVKKKMIINQWNYWKERCATVARGFKQMCFQSSAKIWSTPFVSCWDFPD
jgi:hypothetical protein